MHRISEAERQIGVDGELCNVNFLYMYKMRDKFRYLAESNLSCWTRIEGKFCHAETAFVSVREIYCGYEQGLVAREVQVKVV